MNLTETPTSIGPEQHPPSALLERVRGGDRQACAEFVVRYEARIRRRVRGKLPPAMRRLFDSQEIMSTVARRLDALVASGKLHAVSDGQVWSLVFTIAENSLVEKARVFRGLQAKEGEDGALAMKLMAKLQSAEFAAPDGAEIEIDRALSLLTDRLDRQILSLWLMGRDSISIAAAVELSPATVRKRWERIRERLRETYESGEP